MQLRRSFWLGAGLAGLLAASACAAPPPAATPTPAARATPTPLGIGTKDKPIVIAFVPSQETEKIIKSGDQIAAALKARTGLEFKPSVPTSYAATIEGLCSGKVDVAFVAPLSYVLATSKGCADYLLTSVREGSPTYRGQIRVRTDSGINEVGQLKGKKFAFSDPLSTSGSLYPTLLIKTKFNATPKEFFSEFLYAGGHDKAMIALFNKQVDGAASFIDAKTDVPGSAVRLFPDIAKQTKRITETDDIPGDPQVVRRGLPKDLVEKIRSALLDYAKTEEGKKAFFGLYSIDGFAALDDAKYNGVRDAAKIVGINLEAEAAKTARPPAPPATPTPTKTP